MTHKYHNQILNKFSEEYYADIIKREHLVEEIVLEETPVWLAIVNQRKYLLSREMKKKLPIKIVKKDELVFRNKVYYPVTSYQTVKFTQEKNHTFKQLVDEFANFEHSEPEHYTIYRILGLCAELDRVNFRIATEAGFGKDGFWECLSILRKDVCK